MSTLIQTFSPEVDFCPSCGSLLPSLASTGDVTCLCCKYVVSSKLFDEKVIRYSVEFNSLEGADRAGKKKKTGAVDQADGPVIERKCPKCAHDLMSYAAIQLRSADEGQTVFFTCLKCQYKESENS